MLQTEKLKNKFMFSSLALYPSGRNQNVTMVQERFGLPDVRLSLMNEHLY